MFLSWFVIALSAYPYPQSPLLESTPTELKAVLNYAVDENSPEVVNGVAYPMRVRGSVGLDIDSDGAKMVFVWTEPHFRQSPTITIYRVWPDGRVTRAVEGLAPGELVAASGEAVDLHTLGLAFDAAIGPGESEATKKAMVETALTSGLHVVQYPSFFHMDGREGQRGYVDLSFQNTFSSDVTCEKFEFSQLEAVAAGALDDGRQRYLVAAAGNGLYLYRIDGIRSDGFLEKQVSVWAKPSDYRSLVSTSDGRLAYQSTEGRTKPLLLELIPH